MSQLSPRSGEALSLPRASVVRRLATAAIDYVAMFVLIVAVSIMAPFTAYIADFLFMPLLAAYWAARDLHGGAYAPGKLLGRFRVVDRDTGAIVTWQKAILRNSYYVALILLAALPVIEWANTGLVLLVMLADVIVMVATPESRRLGDLLAGTQVVPVKR